MTINTCTIVSKVRLQMWRMGINTIIHALMHDNKSLAVKMLIELRDLIGKEIEPEERDAA